MNAESVRKTLKITNLTTTNAEMEMMELTTIMYLDKTFYLAKIYEVTHRV